MKKNAITAVIAALFLISALFVAGCAAPDNRTPLEKLMAAMVQTGGNGSEDTSVSANIPLSVANETLTLTAEKDANRLTFVHTAPLPGGTDLATTGLSSKAETTLQIDLSTGKAEFAQTNSMSFMGRNITTTGKGSFDARSYKRGDEPTVSSINSSLSSSASISVTDNFQKSVNDGVAGCFTGLNDYLEKNNVKITVIDLGIASA